MHGNTLVLLAGLPADPARHGSLAVDRRAGIEGILLRLCTEVKGEKEGRLTSRGRAKSNHSSRLPARCGADLRATTASGNRIPAAHRLVHDSTAALLDSIPSLQLQQHSRGTAGPSGFEGELALKRRLLPQARDWRVDTPVWGLTPSAYLQRAWRWGEKGRVAGEGEGAGSSRAAAEGESLAVGSSRGKRDQLSFHQEVLPLHVDSRP